MEKELEVRPCARCGGSGKEPVHLQMPAEGSLNINYCGANGETVPMQACSACGGVITHIYPVGKTVPIW